MTKNNSMTRAHSLAQLKMGARIEHILSGQQFIVTANNGKRATAVDNLVLVVVNDHAHKDWICSTSDLPLNKLKPGDIITKHHSYVITSTSEYIISATRSVDIINHEEYYLVE
ncbi:hypothetical protein L3Q72_15720 [Vibrio sp. JC009]|uniref:hypothetical protein n=1 Tax=Vibrio sp. JC009 TaxID=2912314 RepID=UPI0023AEF383|nr:hypothetical protein [Vibrio sp. JC009]WED24326.1 hypothetical protein L3Q72_15720 [Vibrio sp. JC009]